MKPVCRLALYYFSGTGNSRNVASWVSEVAALHDIVERLMVQTSLTKYKFWGPRYKALKDFTTEKLNLK